PRSAAIAPEAAPGGWVSLPPRPSSAVSWPSSPSTTSTQRSPSRIRSRAEAWADDGAGDRRAGRVEDVWRNPGAQGSFAADDAGNDHRRARRVRKRQDGSDEAP